MSAVSVDELLDVLCVPRVGIYARGTGKGHHAGQMYYGGFWVRNQVRLEAILYDIFVCYQRTLRRVHPWAGGSIEATLKVQKAWETLYTMFVKRRVRI